MGEITLRRERQSTDKKERNKVAYTEVMTSQLYVPTASSLFLSLTENMVNDPNL